MRISVGDGKRRSDSDSRTQQQRGLGGGGRDRGHYRLEHPLMGREKACRLIHLQMRYWLDCLHKAVHRGISSYLTKDRYPPLAARKRRPAFGHLLCNRARNRKGSAEVGIAAANGVDQKQHRLEGDDRQRRAF